ncbi:hypothetical protein EDB85DRAFT_538701 [Lactarius pseudohatsudake]|nr:hypothetical protein EDB85DRAFT_538701 [Lactarius pseudohatsudake]
MLFFQFFFLADASLFFPLLRHTLTVLFLSHRPVIGDSSRVLTSTSSLSPPPDHSVHDGCRKSVPTPGLGTGDVMPSCHGCMPPGSSIRCTIERSHVSGRRGFALRNKRGEVPKHCVRRVRRG